MIYENRKWIKAVVKELRNYIAVSYGFEADVEKLRRLEHFDNKVIVLKKDAHLPVSAELSWVKGKNILNIYSNIRFFKMRGQTNTESRKRAALDGFHKWEGSYKVFGDQPVELKLYVDVKQPDLEPKDWADLLQNMSYGCTNVALITEKEFEWNTAIEMALRGGLSAGSPLQVLSAPAGVIAHNEAFKRSFAFRKKDFGGLPDEMNIMGLGYTLPNDADQGVDVAKHEFGHILGLGDMYMDDENLPFLEMEGIDVLAEPANITDSKLLAKVQNNPDYILNKFPDLADCYKGNKVFDSVMYGNTAIHNNDIEMVIEAFYTGKRQNFQKQGLFGDEISTVLGKGN